MLSEFVEKIRGMAVAASSPQVNGNVTQDCRLIWPDGKTEFVPGVPQRRCHTACDLSAICDVSRDDKDDMRHSIWYSRKAVVLLYDHDDRRDQMRLTLEEHPVLVKLRELERSKTWLSQLEFVRLFRVYFGSYCDDGDFLGTIRRISFKKNEEGQSQILHGRASVGKSLQAELVGVREIPEQVTLKIPIFTGAIISERIPLKCAVDIDPAKETFQMYPFPGAIDEALCDAEGELFGRLSDGCAEGARIYYGAP